MPIVIKKTATVIYQRLQNTNSCTTAIVIIQNINTPAIVNNTKITVLFTSITAINTKINNDVIATFRSILWNFNIAKY